MYCLAIHVSFSHIVPSFFSRTCMSWATTLNINSPPCPPPHVYYEVSMKDKNQTLMCLYEAKANAVARVHLLHACAQSLFHIFSASSSLWPLGGRPAAWWLEGHWLKLAPAVPYIPCTVPATNGNSLMTSLAGSPPCPLPLPLGLC